MIMSLKDLHDHSIIHRDIKPDNFCVVKKGKDLAKDELLIIDFGLSKFYLEKGQHIPYKEGKNMCGTARYCSLNTHLG